MKTVILLLLVAFAMAKYERENHNYWYTALKTSATTGVPYADIGWNYCDLKCLYLEKYYPNTDFVVKTFTQNSAVTPDFAACYVKSGTTLALWNTVATNAFFEKNCGADTEDYLHNTKYTVKTTEG
jgi:hypothetical protein